MPDSLRDQSCRLCGGELPKAWTGRPRSYCSKTCRDRAGVERLARKPLPKPAERPKSAPPGAVPKEGETFCQRVISTSRADYVIDHETGCWEWQKFISKGYPLAGGKKAHHVYWQLANKREIPPGHHIHHRCLNRACVNPDHLELTAQNVHYKHHSLERTGLTLDDIKAIRELVTDRTLTYEQIAERYGVTHPMVVQIAAGKWWFNGEPVAMPPRPCVHCGAEIDGGRRNTRYCSEDCKRAARTERQRARKALV